MKELCMINSKCMRTPLLNLLLMRVLSGSFTILHFAPHIHCSFCFIMSGKRKDLTNAEKLQIIQAVECNNAKPVSCKRKLIDIAAEFRIAPSTLSTFIKDKDKIVSRCFTSDFPHLLSVFVELINFQTWRVPYCSGSPHVVPLTFLSLTNF